MKRGDYMVKIVDLYKIFEGFKKVYKKDAQLVRNESGWNILIGKSIYFIGDSKKTAFTVLSVLITLRKNGIV